MQSYSNNIRVIDIMPIHVGEFGNAYFGKYFKVKTSYGKCPSKKMIYLGFKFHLLTTVDVFINDYIITLANIYDRNAVYLDKIYKY